MPFSDSPFRPSEWCRTLTGGDITEVSSGSIPRMDGTVRDLVNRSFWFLYRVRETGEAEAAYYLSADGGYLLRKDGSILRKVSVRPSGPELGGRLMFSDIPKPEALLKGASHDDHLTAGR